MSDKKLRTQLFNYLSKKELNVIMEDYDSITWNYNVEYSNFIITLSFWSDHVYNESDNYNISYYINANVPGFRNKKTKASGNFCSRVHKNLLLIKDRLNIIAGETKKSVDIKNKYCTELESFYKRKHKSVEIATYNENVLNPDSMIINVNCYDEGVRTYYKIKYINNKYYLVSKIEELEKKLEINF